MWLSNHLAILRTLQVRRVKALRTTGGKRPRDEEDGEETGGQGDGGGGDGGDGGGQSEGEERVATAAARAKRPTRRKNKSRKVM